MPVVASGGEEGRRGDVSDRHKSAFFSSFLPPPPPPIAAAPSVVVCSHSL